MYLKGLVGFFTISRLVMEDEPDLRPGTPIIEDFTEGKEDSEAAEPPLTVSLSWEAPRHSVKENLSVIYHVEYYRDQWQLWLKGKTCRQPLCTLTGPRAMFPIEAQ